MAMMHTTSEQKAFAKLCQRAFACPEDAMREWEKFQAKLHDTNVHELKIRQQPHYPHRGKPKQGETPERGDYFLTGSVASCLMKRSQLLKNTRTVRVGNKRNFILGVRNHG